MGPQKAVVTPASSAADATVVSRMTRMSMPIDRAYPSPSRSALRARTVSRAITMPATTTGTSNFRSDHVVAVKLPRPHTRNC